jgi:hypothetical protein
VGQTVELLDSLKGALRNFAAREDKASQDFRVKVGREFQHRDEALEQLNNKLTADLADEDVSFQSAIADAVARYELRKAWISRARKSSKELTLERIENKTGSRKYGLQKRLIQAQHDRDNSLAAAGATLGQFKQHLAAEQSVLAGLETSARSAFRGYGKFRRLLSNTGGKTASSAESDENELLVELRELLGRTREEIARFRLSPLPMLFRFLPIWLLVLVSPTPWLLSHFNVVSLSQSTAIGISVGAFFAVCILYLLGGHLADSAACRIADHLGRARRLHDSCAEKAELWQQQEIKRITEEFQNATVDIDQQLKMALKENVGMKGDYRERIDDKTVRITARNEKVHQTRMDLLNHNHTATIKRLQRTADAKRAEIMQASQAREAAFNAEFETQWQSTEKEWRATLEPIYSAFKDSNALAEKLFQPWEPQLLDNWTPPPKFEHAAKFGLMEVDAEKFGEAFPRDKRLVLPGPTQFSVPLLLTYPRHGSILFETGHTGHDEAVGALNNIILRLLSIAPPGRLNFTILDPVGLGQNFAGVMHLADYGEQLINSRIWTQTAQIEQKLADLNEHMEKVIQMYLRNEYETIAEYNEAAGNIAEKYHYLVVADFPVNFSEAAIKRLLSIASSGARCGVYALIHWDNRHAMPQEFVPDELRKQSVAIGCRGTGAMLVGRTMPGVQLRLDAPPAEEYATNFIHKVGRASRDSSRVEVPFAQVAPPDSELWTEETTSELRVPIGRTGATKLQYLAIGKGTRQHALVAGKTGSGKSTLFHVIITNLALWSSPEQVEFYLIDFKKGVEFKCYGAKHLPHARVVAIESDREFGLSVLERVDDELKRRGDMFRKLGVQDIAGYKKAGGTEPVPRSLLMIDEFQEFFVEDDKIAQTASVLLDRIVRQGRAFGIHVILGSQTLGGAYTVARTTLGQMVIRIALQCNEADAYLIMDDSNPAPRLLSRPGEGIYNDTAGSVEGNSPFQAVWLSDDIRDSYLDKIQARAKQSGVDYPGPIVFEGDAPADVRENPLLENLLKAETLKPVAAPRIWLGAPNSIKGPTEAVFHRQSGNNLIIVGQRDEAALAMLSVGLISLAAQLPRGAVRIFVFDGTPPGSPHREYLDRIIQAVPHPVTIGKNNDLGEIMSGLISEMKTRTDDQQAAAAPITFLFFHGIQRFNKLRQEDDFSFSSDDTAASPGAQLNQLICDGTRLGFHVIATCDTYNNVNRFISRKAFTEFEMRVLFQMSANDSASLIDNPKAGSLGLHRAVLYNQQEGSLEMFRPYALPDKAWIEQATTSLARLVK